MRRWLGTKGVSLGVRRGKSHRQRLVAALSYTAKIQFNGNLLVRQGLHRPA